MRQFVVTILYLIIVISLYIIWNYPKEGFQNNTPDLEIVIANYEEDIEWVNKIPRTLYTKLTIYNKGKPKNYDSLVKKGAKVYSLPNIGREGHTYYKHIYDNYDNLADYTIFLQGNPFDHSPNIISNLNKYVNNRYLNIDFEFLSETVYNCNLNGCIHHKNLPLIEIYEKLFNKRKEYMEFKFGAGAQFIVSKKKILQRPKEFYLKIVEMLDNNINPIEGFVIERFHNLIFN